MAERTAMPVADETEALSAVFGYRVISADLDVRPSVKRGHPAQNEARKLPHVFASIHSWVDEIVVVVRDSEDDTVERAALLHPYLKDRHTEGPPHKGCPAY